VITAEKLRELMEYDADTGVMRWRVRMSNFCHAGRIVGTLQSRRGLETHIARKSYQVHRLIWLWVYGEWPKYTIDHINGNREDNRLCNLRDVSMMGNCQNQRRAKSTSKTGILGVIKVGSRYKASITAGYKLKHIGTFATAQEAHAAYLRVKREIHATCVI